MEEAHQPTIMVVEDDPDTIGVICDLLTLHGLRVLACPDSQAAQTCIAAEQPQLVILDVEMAGLDGIELFTQMRADPATRGVPVIFFTASPDRLSERLVDYKARGSALLVKPNIHLLPPLVEQMLAQERGA